MTDERVGEGFLKPPHSRTSSGRVRLVDVESKLANLDCN